MVEILKCLLLEDEPEQAARWIEKLEKENYRVFLCRRTEEADEIIESKSDNYFDIIAVDLGLPPRRDYLEIGTKYVISLRERLPLMPIMAYTALMIRSHEEVWNFQKVIRVLLPLRVSLVYTRHLPEIMRFEKAVSLTTRGILVVSSHLSDMISDAISIKADPLSDQYWESLRNISITENLHEAAELTKGVQRGGLAARIEKMKIELMEKGEFEFDDVIYLEDLVNWYKRNKTKYLRD